MLLASHVMQVDLVEADLCEVVQPLRMTCNIGTDKNRSVHVLGSDMACGLVELLDRRCVPAQGRTKNVCAPLVVRDLYGLVFIGGPRQVDLQSGQLVRAPTLPECIENLLECVGRLRNRDQPVGPTPQPASRLFADGGSDELRCLRGERP